MNQPTFEAMYSRDIEHLKIDRKPNNLKTLVSLAHRARYFLGLIYPEDRDCNVRRKGGTAKCGKPKL